MLNKDSKLIKYLENIEVHDLEPDCNDFKIIATSIVCCLDSIVLISDSRFDGNLIPLGNILIKLVLSYNIKIVHLNFLAPALSLLNKIAFHNSDWQNNVIGSLLGIGKTYMIAGIQGAPEISRQKVRGSQQSLVEVNNENKVGRIFKTRKSRTLEKWKITDVMPEIDDLTVTDSMYK